MSVNASIGPHKVPISSPVEMIGSLFRHRQLAFKMVKREVVGRYRGSVMGIAWSFFNPLLMLAVYTFIFTVVFQARWSGGEALGKANFAILVFVGLIIHGIFSECINKAPNLIVGNVNYVKKVIFPLDILPWVSLGSALFHAGISLIVLLCAQLVIGVGIPWTALLFPLVLLPLVFASMGVCWFLAASGVYLRDITHVTGVASSILLFLSPIFYPISALPPTYQILLRLNPLTYLIEEGRNTLILGEMPDMGMWFIAIAVSMLTAWLGFVWFQKTRKGFSDVL